MAQTGLAVGERVGASGKEILTAVALAYDINGRFARHLRDEHSTIHIFPAHARRHLILNTAICAAKLLGLGAEDVNRVIGVAWTFSPPEMEFIVTKNDWIPEPVLWICQLGIQAALMVQSGAGGTADILDKDGDTIYDLPKLTKSPSPYYYIINELCLKPRIGSYGYQGALQLVASIFRSNKLEPADVESIVLRLSSMYTHGYFSSLKIPNTEYPRSVIMSLPWNVAMAAVGHDTGVDHFAPENLTNRDYLKLAKKVKVEAAASPLINEVEVITSEKTYRDKIERKNFLGDPSRPLSQEHLEEKFFQLAAPTVGARRARRMIAIFRDFEKLDNVRKLTKYYSAPKSALKKA